MSKCYTYFKYLFVNLSHLFIMLFIIVYYITMYIIMYYVIAYMVSPYKRH